MRRIQVGAAICACGPVEYYLLEENEAEPGARYGVEVAGGGERETVRGVTDAREALTALMEGMICGGVTPVSARYIVEDWLLA